MRKYYLKSDENSLSHLYVTKAGETWLIAYKLKDEKVRIEYITRFDGVINLDKRREYTEVTKSNNICFSSIKSAITQKARELFV